MTLPSILDGSVHAMRPFLPAKDFKTSLRFYGDLGCRARMLDDKLAEMHLGPHAFLLQDYYVQQWADNFMMHVMVGDVRAWWDHIASLNLAEKYGVRPPRAPKPESWGLTVAYLFDPAGVLWHFAEDPVSTDARVGH